MSVSRYLDGRFVGILGVFVGLVFVFYRESILGPPLSTWTGLTAETTAMLLQWLGMDAVRQSTVIAHSGGFSYEVYYRCTGFLPVAFLVVSTLAYRATWRSRVVGIALGVPILLLLNIVRLVHLFHIGVSHPAWFDFAHAVVWEAAMILAIVATWFVWTVWVNRSEERSGAPVWEAPRTALEATRAPARGNPAR